MFAGKGSFTSPYSGALIADVNHAYNNYLQLVISADSQL